MPPVTPGFDDADIPRAGQITAAATAFAALFSAVGIGLYGLTFFYDFFVKDYGWTRQQVTSGNAYAKLLIGPLFGYLAGYLIDRYGPRRLLLVGILMAGGAMVGLGYVSTLAAFYVCYLFNALGYVFGGPLPVQVLLSRWFTRARGKAMGFAYLGIGIGGTVVPGLAYWLTSTFGWNRAMQVLGLLMITIAWPLAWLVKDAPPSYRAAAPGSAAATTPLGEVLRTPAFYLLLVGSMCSIGAVGGTMQNLKLYLSLDHPYGQGEIARILSLVLAGSILGRLLMGWLADRWARKHVMLLIYVIVAASIPLLLLADSWTMLHLFALLFGIGLGGDYMIIPLMAADLFGVQRLGRVMGFVLTADGIAEAVSPMLVAGLRDRMGTYRPGFLLLMGLAAVGAAAVALLPQKKAH
ncbi:MFS transporter [Luteitalea sp. TBR-22]|uniref:MFS transporter n=1 Tax=Luteitalea sp. TBR-22 TaxID=2802971 RepID=UPI001AF78C22|nr:MFS transporter [Luteitalea sp. TBR-22]BCS34339.1 MFS transporter [Luteitalea sp. TBR-22]